MNAEVRHRRARSELVDIASRLLAEEGPEAVSVRRVTSGAGTSTMAVYTCFGDMGSLVREIVLNGYARLVASFGRIPWSADPVADMALLGRTYRNAAVADPHLYSVMFGGRAPAGFRLTESDRGRGRRALERVAECARRCVADARFRRTDTVLLAHHLWLAVHGMVMLEIGQYLGGPAEADRCFEHQLVALMVGAGDAFEPATRSVRRSADRFTELAEVVPTA